MEVAIIFTAMFASSFLLATFPVDVSPVPIHIRFIRKSTPIIYASVFG